ncbi:MAG: response regulator [Candidatus Aminicenantes bacterium]|jgi:DNA-binding NtrC family response regulator|nr:response regulator [Candidatus Aminicenantes bacterium]
MKRILVIDDDWQMREMMHQALERAGYEVAEAANGKIGLNIQREDPVDLVITDLIMPEKEGIETIRELRRDFPDMKIIAISGGGRASAEGYLSVAKTIGAHRTLSKPFDLKKILDLVEELLGQ